MKISQQKYWFLIALLLFSMNSFAGKVAPPPPDPVEDCDISSTLDNDLSAGNSFDDNEECSVIAQGNTVTPEDNLRTGTSTFTNSLNSVSQGALGNRNGQNVTSLDPRFQQFNGLSAGNEWENYSFWLSYSRVESEDDLTSTAFDSSSNNAMFGVDYLPAENMVVGLAFMVEDNDVTTVFNTGSQDIQGFMIAPYIGYSISDMFSVDGSIGYGGFDIDQLRTDFGTSTLVAGDTDSDRWFIAANLNAYKNVGNWYLSGRLGLVYSEEDQDGYAESGAPGAAINPNVPSQEIEFGQLQFGGEAAYSFGSLEPFLNAFFEYDFEREKIRLNAGQAQPSNDRDDFRLGMGVRYFSAAGFSGILQWNSVLSRTNFDSHEINLLGRFEF